jgi:hypothetical protein
VNGRPWAVEIEQHLVPTKGHDRYLVSDDFLGVADGATPLRPTWPDPGPFAAAALSALLTESAAPSFDARAVFERAIRRAASPGPHVSCAVVVAMRHGADLTVAALGDCTATLSLADGRRLIVVDHAVAALDAAALRDQEVHDRLLEHRLRMNRDDSYWIFADQPTAAAHIKTATVPVDSVTAVMLATDGHSTAHGVDDSTVLRATPGPAVGLGDHA